MQPTQPAAQRGLSQPEAQASPGAQNCARRAGNQMVGQKQQLPSVCTHHHSTFHCSRTAGSGGSNIHSAATAQAQSSTHCTPHAQITAFHTQAGAQQSNRIQKHLGKNQAEEAATTDARHPQLPHLHITGWRLVALVRSQLQHKTEIRGHSVPAAKQNQHHGHIWTVPYGRQPVQCPQTSRAKREAHRRWHPDHPEACTCAQFREKFPDNLRHGHIAIELSKVAPDMPCLEFSGKSNVLPDQKTLMMQLRKAIQRWHRSNGLPVPRDEDTEMTNFIQQQLTQHHQHAKNTLNIHMLKALQERLPAGIVHCEDHFADRLIWYCPSLYHKCITGTFMNAEVFQTSEHQPLLLHEATHQWMLKRLPKHKWAFPNWGRIPTAYVLPKRKKDFATGRPILSFVQAQGRVLWESFADVLSLMVRQACPDSLGEGSGVNQLHLIKQHFRNLSETTRQEHMTREDITCMNQDLAGFFTSISSDRFIDSYHLLLRWYQQRNTRHATTFTVAHSESLPDARVHRGSYKHSSHTTTTTTRLRRHSLHIHKFPDIISAILELNYFMVGGRVVRQARGAPMGSPASPALCSMVVAVHEQAWANTYRNYLYNAKHMQPEAPHLTTAGFFATRYVDNRLMMIPTRMVTLPPFAVLIHKDFYVPPVELEMELGYGFLGMELDPDQCAIHYTRQIQQNDVPSPHSATTNTVLHSGVKARLRQARSVCVPQSAIAMAEAALKGGYLAAGHDPRMIQEA